MTGPTRLPDVGRAVARGHRTALLRAWRRVCVAALLSVAVLIGSITLRGALASGGVAGAAAPAATSAPSSPTAMSPLTSVETTEPLVEVAPPGAPQDVQVTYDDPADPTAIIVRWSAPASGGPVDRYVVHQGETEFEASPGAFEHRIQDDGAVHTYAVAAIGPQGLRSAGQEIVFPGLPAGPVILSAEAVERSDGGWDVSVSWEQPDTGGPVIGFVVLLDGSEKFYGDGTNRSATFPADKPGNAQVTATNPAGDTPSNTVFTGIIAVDTPVEPSPLEAEEEPDPAEPDVTTDQPVSPTPTS